MQKRLIAAALLGTALLTACGTNNKNVAESPGIYKHSGNTINKQNDEDLYNPEKVNTQSEKEKEFGFVRQVKSPVPNKNVNFNQDNAMNREKVAKSISNILVTIPNVHDASVLVTDEEVLVAYRTDAKDKKDRFEVADQVKKTAMSVVPRWFHVYVTDDTSLRQDVKNIAYMDSNSQNKEETIKGLVKRMLSRSPQGRKVNDGENPNGEVINKHKNKAEDQDEYRERMDNGNL
ncbi:YhcN/YlaJ family sporulation lipoprotein [Heyndrickxia sporothermodurans]|uniref:Sporulation protein n=1 Tax=Heyndrickxia sporothermodurans TaxID=46224 RepID=A0A150KK00_9BACI|nr:YhcN/YlaJ family sporulation lipoprotein [Heyndrickxia sporothermodurans]KYC86358.1 hypothetical protein B4102_0646 [Heyndrickxia sporothermodurans]MEB6548746.1 YhcN/YlaJ family sporulation lipoprotein [Heyndrickxia sporothermodurans]